MSTMEEREGIRAAVRALLDADRPGCERKSLDQLKNLFPGYWDVVAEEYEARSSVIGDSTSAGGAPQGTIAPAGPEDRLGPYRIMRELGRGGMGVVYLAEDTRLKRKVALKVVSPAFASSAHLRRRFQREAEVASRVDHPGVCTVFESGEHEQSPFIAMRYVEGETLAHWIAKSRGDGDPGQGPRPSDTVTRLPGSPSPDPRSGSLEVSARAPGPESKVEVHRVLVLIEKTARALHVAHESGLIHRDIKPGNIMVTPDGEPVLLDFGLARDEEGAGETLTQTGALMGTPAYMSPEQLVAQRIRLDRRTDVYSLGATLYECLTLRLPFEAPTRDALYQMILATDPEDPRRLNRSIPEDLKVVLETVLEKDRNRRYQTALDLAEELRRVRENEPIQARPIGPILRLGRWARRRPGVAVGMAALFICLAGGLIGSQVLLERARFERDGKAVALKEKSEALERAERERRDAQAERDAKALALRQLQASEAQRDDALRRIEVLVTRLDSSGEDVVKAAAELAELCRVSLAKTMPGEAARIAKIVDRLLPPSEGRAEEVRRLREELLALRPGFLDVSQVPGDLAVRIDGLPVPADGGTIRVSPGAHSIEFRRPGLEPVKQEEIVQPEEVRILGVPVLDRPCRGCLGSGAAACNACRGSGAVACLRCGGKGIVTSPGRKTACAYCGGTGKESCPVCVGAGRVACSDCR